MYYSTICLPEIWNYLNVTKSHVTTSTFYGDRCLTKRTVPNVRKQPNYLTYFHTSRPSEFGNAAKM